MFQVRRSPQVFDVIVIGSGAGGGTTVKVLTDLGVNVALLEAGPMLNPAKDFKEHLLPYQVDHRGAGPHAEQYFGRQQWGYFSAPNGYWDIDGETYTVAKDSEFRWFRSRIIGGRTNHYGRISLRFSDYDFQPYSFDGLDRKSTRLNSSHLGISYAVFCLKKKKKQQRGTQLLRPQLATS